jgi:hypothetical protein
MEPLSKFFRIHHTSVGGEIKKRIVSADFPGVVNFIQDYNPVNYGGNIRWRIGQMSI